LSGENEQPELGLHEAVEFPYRLRVTLRDNSITTMPQVFISYRQVNDAQRKRVRSFGERLRDCGIKVILDQFYLDDHPGGPPDKWPKWSSDQAINAERVIIIGSEAWFLCFDGKQAPGTGLGAACEADDLRQRIYDSANINENIRVVLFDDADSKFVSFKLKGYHRFHAEHDFNAIVKWLGGTQPSAAPVTKPSTPNNLPPLYSFFGREKELKTIADALAPEARTWGALIDGPGGMGKTSLAVRAAELVPPNRFKQIIFLSAKERELTADGQRPLKGFVLPSYLQMLNELANQLGQPELAKLAEEERTLRLQQKLQAADALLILDNLESLSSEHRDQIFAFVGRLPHGCKAIVTSRRRTDVDARIIRLEKLDQKAALELLAELAPDRPLLAKATEPERLHLYEETGGNPLLLRWIAGQLGKGRCRTVDSALAFIRSSPPGNDPLEFIFGDLLETFTETETKVLAALVHFTSKVEVKFIAELAEVSKGAAQTALGDLANRALVIPDEEEKDFSLVPMVADFLRNKRPEVVNGTGSRLEERAYALIVENGYSKHERFSVLDAAWPSVAPALPRFLAGPNARLQTACNALDHFLEYTGRWDEWLSLSQQAETKALAADNHRDAGWRAYQIARVHYLRGQADKVLACADRVAAYWKSAHADVRESSIAVHLRGVGYELKEDYASAITAYREALDLHRSLSSESADVAIALSAIADAEKSSGDLIMAERDFREALRIASAIKFTAGVASYTGKLVDIALDRQDWLQAENLVRETLPLAEKLGSQPLIADDCLRLAKALIRQGKPTEALPHARRAVDIFTRLGSPYLEAARATLAECEPQ
jgi:tetratricopeptide (TPR) repeat protein